MGDQETIEDLKERLASQARLFEERLSAIEASRDAGGLQEASAGGDQPPTGFEGVGTSGQAGFATSSRVGVTTNSLLQTVGDEVELQEVAVSPWDHERPVASNLLFPNSAVVGRSFRCESDILRVLLLLMAACRPSRLRLTCR